ncbi:hypothetical protein AVEN_125068-1, partial [Araneus ventricosus]|uniref:Uncharacterized protein n=1 Tax=Araneus ventricosus TaxID=182803 RepID=A0A4Y2KJY5_ARAVE
MDIGLPQQCMESRHCKQCLGDTYDVRRALQAMQFHRLSVSAAMEILSSCIFNILLHFSSDRSPHWLPFLAWSDRIYTEWGTLFSEEKENTTLYFSRICLFNESLKPCLFQYSEREKSIDRVRLPKSDLCNLVPVSPVPLYERINSTSKYKIAG